MRYILNFKIEVIAYYQQGHTGLATSEVLKVDLKLVRKRVNQYQSGGIEAIKPKESKAFMGTLSKQLPLPLIEPLKLCYLI